MRVKLNTEVQSMFPLLGLSWENPGPVEIDLEKLNQQQRLWIENGVKKNVLIPLDPMPAPKPVPVPTPKPTLVTPPKIVSKVEEATQLKQQASQDRQAKLESATDLLKSPQPAIKAYISSSKDLLQLRMMRDLEIEGKERSKLLEMLNKRIGELEQSVGSVVGTPLTGDTFTVTSPLFRDLPEVEEEIEEDKTVTIKQE